METRLTPHRQAVLDVVRSSKDHPTAREVFDRSSRSAPLSFATVYNALNYLSGHGHIRAVRFGDDAVRYDPVTERHDHLICRRCGAVIDAVGLAAPGLPPGHPAAEGFEVHEVTVHYYGICAVCRRRSRAWPDT